MKRVSKDLIESLLEACQRSDPNEFLAFLSEKEKGVIDEFVSIPFQEGKAHASFFLHDLPFDPSIQGCFHSHPSNSNRPSNADLILFSKVGSLHAIAKRPYRLLDVAFYDKHGKIVEVEWC